MSRPLKGLVIVLTSLALVVAVLIKHTDLHKKSLSNVATPSTAATKSVASKGATTYVNQTPSKQKAINAYTSSGNKHLARMTQKMYQNYVEVMKLYGSYPNAAGKKVLLGKLTSRVSKAALADIKLQWTGDTPITVTSKVTSIALQRELDPMVKDQYSTSALLHIDLTHTGGRTEHISPLVSMVIAYVNGKPVIEKISRDAEIGGGS